MDVCVGFSSIDCADRASFRLWRKHPAPLHALPQAEQRDQRFLTGRSSSLSGRNLD